MKYQVANIKYQALLICVLLIASFLRLYQLGANPPSLDWDEASLGYNAYSLLKTGRDEFGRMWPVSIRSFEDYKPAFYAYLTIPVIAVFGLNEFSVRLPSAILGILSVICTFYLVRRLLNTKVGLLASLLLAISPWHLQFSRVAFEANAALFFVITGIVFFLKGLKKGQWFIVSCVFFILSVYTYHSPRLVVPLVLMGWTLYFRRQLWEKKFWVGISVFVGVVLLIPFVRELTGSGRARFSSVTVLNAEERLTDSIPRIEYDQQRGDWLGKLLHNRRIVYGLAILKGYLDHYNLDFLFLTGDAPDRHHARDVGMLFLWEILTIPVGLLVLYKSHKIFPLFWWFLVAPAASAITTGTPHAVRALLYLPTYQIFSAVGLIHVSSIKYQVSRNLKRVLSILLLLIFMPNLVFYFESYYVHTPVEAAKDWQYGYKEVVALAKKYEDQVDKIIITYRYDQPHVFVLFYDRIDPIWYQGQNQGGEVKRFERNIGKYEFRNLIWDEDQELTNVLLVGTPGEIPDGIVGKLADIYFPDGSVAFRVVKR